MYIVMPAYNEEENIIETVKKWYKILDNKDESSKIIITDSSSTDKTHELLLDLQKTYSQLDILENTDKQHGPKVISLYDYAIKNNIDYIFQTDSDGQTNSDEFEKFWQMRDKYDIILGHRIQRQDGKSRAFVERVVCFLLHIYFGGRVPDANAPFRLMKTEIVKKYLYKMKSNYNLPNIMMTTYFAYYHEKYKFVPVSFKPRQGGVNSINITKIFRIRIGYKALSDFSAFKKEMSKKV